MALLTWFCLLFMVVAVVGSIGYAAARGLRAWRTFKRLTRTVSGGIEDVVRRGEAAEAHATALSANAERLTTSLAHLQQSLAELAILRSAFADARSTLSVRMPGK